MKYAFTIEVGAADHEQALAARNEIEQRIADAFDSGKLKAEYAHAGDIEPQEPDQIDKLYIEKAQDKYALGSSDNIEINSDAKVGMCDDGAWVEARVWVRNDDDIDRAIEALDSVGVVESEGGHCD